MAIPARGPWLGALFIAGVGAALLFFSGSAKAKDAGPTWEPLLAQLEAYEFARTGQRIRTQRIREAIVAGDLEGARVRLSEYNKALANWADPVWVALAEKVVGVVDPLHATIPAER